MPESTKVRRMPKVNSTKVFLEQYHWIYSKVNSTKVFLIENTHRAEHGGESEERGHSHTNLKEDLKNSICYMTMLNVIMALPT